ncbi:DGQHR domain-containing protein [Burkholderia contaminans]|uniref:DGQHR domain-containing protein n=1 Tax=Burkholderia contaminans TaxID=488447 RepID=UPI0031105D9E
MTTKPKEYTYDCLEAEQNGHKLHLFFAPAKEIYSFVSVNQKEEDADEGYQRAASPARTSAITRFVNSGNVIPLSILITLEKKAATFDKGEITIKAGKKSGWVIDGQHRLIGSMNANDDVLLPVVAFIGLSIDEQIQQFVTVNKEAKGVPTSLYYSLLKKLPPKLSPAELAKERAADIALALRADENSPFSARIVSTTAPKNGQLSLVNFVRKIAPIIREDTGLLGTYNLEDQVKIIDNFYVALRNVFPTDFASADPVFFQTIGFGGLFNFFPTLFSFTLGEKQSFAIADVTEVLGAISHVDVSQWKKSGTGNAAEISLGKDLVEEFRQYAVKGSHGGLKLS